jgi:ABC-type maltose transport system permease subunit
MSTTTASPFYAIRQSLPKNFWDYFILAVLFGFMLFFLMPVYVMVVTGLKEARNVSLSTMWNLPAQLSGGGFAEAWNRLEPNLGNSLMMAIPATIISAVWGSINGYVFAKWKFRGSNLLFALLVFGMFIPYQSILIPLIQFLQQVKLYGTIYGLMGSVADRYKRLFRIYLAFHVRGHRDELPVALDSLRHPDSRHGSPSLTASSALSSTLVHRRGDYHLRAVVPAL